MAKRKPAEPPHPAVATPRGRRILAERAAEAANASRSKPATGERLRQQQALFGRAWAAPVVSETTPKQVAKKRPPAAKTDDPVLGSEKDEKRRPEPTSAIVGAIQGQAGSAKAGPARKKPVTDRMTVPIEPVRGSIWTPENTSLAVRMWTEQKASLSMIAEALSKAIGQAVGRNSVIGKMQRLGLTGKGGGQAAQGGWATKPERQAKASEGSVRPPRTLHAEPIKPAANITGNVPNEPDLSALFGVRLTERPSHAPGRWPIADLRSHQCRFPCNDLPRGGLHLFCGELAPIGPGNPHGSWCDAHRAVVFDNRSGADRPAWIRGMGR